MIKEAYQDWISNPKLQKEGFPQWYAFREYPVDSIPQLSQELGVLAARDHDEALEFLKTATFPIVKVEPFTMLQKQVELFMRHAEQEIPSSVGLPSSEVADLRANILTEELDELIEGMDCEDFVEVADGIADLIYVAIGTAIAYGIKMQPIWDEVQRSNMSKFIDGHRAPTGKWIKGSSYSPANIERLINEQRKVTKSEGN